MADTVSTGEHGFGELEEEVRDEAPLPPTGSPLVNLLRRMDKFSEVIQCGVGMATSPSNWMSENNLPATHDSKGDQCVFNEAAASAICIAVDVRLREVMLERLTAQYLLRVYGAKVENKNEYTEGERTTASHWADEIVKDLWA